jgi:DNA (cytosine-5)-methyltransferase 1
MKLQYGSLFAGVGGFDMGMEQAGYEPVFQVEWDKNCQKILHHHWPTVPKWGDVCDVNGADLPPCDVLIFGSPCQDLSVAGKRAGLQDGDRSSMFFEAVRIIKEMRDATNSIYPRATIWENVPGALSSNKGADFGVVLSSLADIGAITQEYAVLDAQYFGVPQRRRRIFLVSIYDSAASERCPDPLLPLIQGSRGDFAKSRKARKDSARFASTSIDPGNGEGFRMLAFGHYTDDDTASAIKMRDYKDATDLVVPVAYSIREDAKANNFSATETDTALCLNGLVPSTQSHHAQIFIAEPQPPYVFDGTRHDDFRMDTETVPTLKQRMGTGGGQVPMLAEPIYSFDTQFGSNAAVFEDTSPTLKSSQQPPSVSPPGLAVRRLTPLECERLMGWPDDHTRWTADGKEQADTNRYKQCGNGVASCVARWVGEQLRPVLET